MSIEQWSVEKSRRVVKRIIVEGDLVLQTPAHFGGGDGQNLTDMPLLIDPYDGRSPLLTGASIAGALRSYLRACEYGYAAKAKQDAASVALFGGLKGDDDGDQSPLIIEDAIGKSSGLVIREGVKLAPYSRTAEEDKLFDVELWQVGTRFPLRFELVLTETDDESLLCQAMVTALQALENGYIALGARKRRGYGQVAVEAWRVKSYDLKSADSLLDWLENGSQPLDNTKPHQDIQATLGIRTPIDDRRRRFLIQAEFFLEGSILIRSGTGKQDLAPDMVHLHALQPNGPRDGQGRSIPQPIISGTALAGALRARALKIANTLAHPNRQKAAELVDDLFGVFGEQIREMGATAASRILVKESRILHAEDELVQNRVSLDRFTGGARDTALFNQQPTFGGNDSRITLSIELQQPGGQQEREHEIGLLLLLIKDLWTGDLPLGGESSVGRGRLGGLSIHLQLFEPGKSQEWHFESTGNGKLEFTQGDPQDLEKYVTALNQYLKGAQA